MNEQTPPQGQNMGMPPPAMPAMHKNTLMAVLSYIGPLVIVSYLVAKDDPFVKFHIKQGLVLFVIEIAVWLLGMFLFFYMFWVLLQLVNLGVLILSIVGIVHAAKGEERPLPVVGQYAARFSF